MASTGNTFPTAAANVDRAGNAAWSTPTNVLSDNGTDTTVAVPSDYLVTSAYGFTVPALATINGVTVRVEATETGTGNSNYTPQLHSDTTPTLIGSAKSPVTVTGTTPTISSNGGSTDLWSATLTPQIVRAAGFGVSIWSTDTGNTLAIDFVTIAVDYSTVPLTREIDAPISSGFARRRVISNGFVGPNLLLGTLGIVALSTVMCRGPSTVQTIQRIVADPFDAPNLLLSAFAPVAQKPFVVTDPGEGARRVRVTLPENAPANILLLSPAPAARSNEQARPQRVALVEQSANLLTSTLAPVVVGEPPPVSRVDEYKPRPRNAVTQDPPNVLLSTLKLAADMAAAPMLRGPSIVSILRTAIADPFEAPNLLLQFATAPAASPPFVSRFFDTRQARAPVAPAAPPNLLTSTLAVLVAPPPIGLQDQFEHRAVPRVVSSGSSHSQPLTLGIPADVAAPPFRSTSFEERPRTRRVVAPQNQGSLLGLYGITGWGPVIQEITDGRARRPITRIDLEQPPNLLLFTLSLPVVAQPIGEQWFATRALPRPVAADVPPNILLTTLAQQPQALPIGDAWFVSRPIRRPIEADQPPNLVLGTLGLAPPQPFVAQWFDYRPISRPVEPSIPPNLLLSTLVPQPFPVSIHNAHWEFERQITNHTVVSDGSFAGPLLTLGLEAADTVGYLVGTVRVVPALVADIQVNPALVDDVLVSSAIESAPRTRPEE
jgi:hypothetical protein